MRKPPKDLICKFKVKGPIFINNKWIPGWKFTWTYFHLSLNCMQLGRRTIEASYVYISNEIFKQLKVSHKDWLMKKDWWNVMKHRFPKDK